MVKEISCSKNHFTPKRFRSIHGEQKGVSYLNKMTILAFNYTILFWSPNTTRLKKNAMINKVSSKGSVNVFGSVIIEKNLNFNVKLGTYHLMKSFETGKNLTFIAK